MSLATVIAAPTVETIERLLSAARERADAISICVNIGIVDGAGNLAGFLRMPGSFLSSGELAIDKAYTAASFGMTTRGFGVLLEASPRAVRDGLLRRPRLTEVPGGLPILIDGRLAGAIGVSGGSDEEDEDIATYALAAVAHENSGRV